MRPNARQQEAIEYIEGPLLVLAGPGTGKTTLLSARVEQILNVTDTNPENILCLTFTESGASNMREKLLSSKIKGAARKLEIHTYHAFGSYILASYKNYATEFSRNLDSPIDTVFKFKIIKEIQENLPVTDILRSGVTADIVSTIGSAKSARMTGDDLIKIAEKNIEESAELSSEISPLLEQGKPRMKFFEALDKIFTPIMEILARHTSTKNILGDVEPVANILLRDLKRVIDEEVEKDKPSVGVLTAWRRANFEQDDNGSFRLKDRISNLKLKSLGGIMNAYDARLEAEGLFDFEDMIEEAIKILKKDRGFRLTCQERFQYILLDEFQDTNPSQFEIIKLLTDYEQPNVMAVGDDDQAIFAFQGADASNLLNFQQFYNAKVINLEENYRSNQEILDLSREIADQISDSFAKNRNVNKNLKAFHGFGAEISRHEFLTSDSEYEFVTEEIEKLIKSGVKQSSIAVIAPKHKYLIPIVPFLKESGKINIAYEKRENVLEDPRLAEILTLARFVYDLSLGKNISSRLLEILAFPFWEIKPSEAIRAVYQAKADHKAGIDYLINSESEKLKQLGEFLATLAMRAFDTPLELMLDYMVGTVELSGFRSPFVEFYDKEQGEYATFELYENLAVLKEAIKNHTRSQAPRLKDLILLVDDYKFAGEALMNVSPYRDSDDAVQLVTAHKSKGLEYEYVFMIAVDNASWGKAKGNNTTLTLPKNMLQIRHTGITDDERLRLIFVAMTRAKRVLTMTNSLKDFSGKSPARLDYLDERVEGEGEVISPFIGKVKLHYEDLSEVRKKVDLRKSWRAAYTKLSPELRPILLSRMENYRLSASDLTTFIDISYGGPLEFYQRKVLRAPQEPATEAMVFGNLIHACFEKITNSARTETPLKEEEVIEYYRKEAEKADVSDKEIKNLLEKGEVALKISLKQFEKNLWNKNARAEVNLGNERIEIEGVPVTGKLDHIEIDEENKTIEVFDYKTGKYQKKNWGSVSSLYKYSLQLGFYKLMLENSVSYRKYKVKKGHILFVTPDEEGRVYDKELDFDEFNESELKAMMKAVYKQATTLTFLDDEELKVEADKDKGLREVKDFIQLLLAKTDV